MQRKRRLLSRGKLPYPRAGTGPASSLAAGLRMAFPLCYPADRLGGKLLALGGYRIRARNGANMKHNNQGPTGSRWFTFPAHQTGRARFEHPALRQASSVGYWAGTGLQTPPVDCLLLTSSSMCRDRPKPLIDWWRTLDLGSLCRRVPARLPNMVQVGKKEETSQAGTTLAPPPCSFLITK